MSTVLIIEDQFLSAYELECDLKDRGYGVVHTATKTDALKRFRSLKVSGELAAIVCDNRLIDGEPAASQLYRAVRAHDPEVPFIVYSGFPPNDLPKNDPRLFIIRKPFIDQVISQIGLLTHPRGKGCVPAPSIRGREAA